MVFDTLPKVDQVRTAVDFAVVRIGNLPKYNNVERAYHGPEYLRKKFNCAGVVNQCAIRMSVALQRCGFSLDGFPTPARVHGTSLRRCTLEEPHIIGANELMQFLIDRFGLTTTRLGTPSTARVREAVGPTRHCLLRQSRRGQGRPHRPVQWCRHLQ